MKDWRNWTLKSRVCAAFAVVMLMGCSDSDERSLLDYHLPADIAGPLAQATDSDFSRDAWHTFLALAAPTVGASVSLEGDNPTQWSRWSSTVDMITCNLDDAGCVCEDGDCSNPGARQYPPACRLVPGHESLRVLASIDKFDDAIFQAKQKGLSDSPLIDVQGNFVRYEILINPPAYRYLVEGGNYDWPLLRGLPESDALVFPCGSESYRGGDPADDGAGSFVLKLAWMEDGLPGEVYHKEDLLVYTPANRTENGRLPTCERKTMALVGMHVAHKTVKQPNWTWSTWEHRLNAPDCAGLPPAGAQDPAYNTNCPAAVERDFNFASADCGDGRCQSCNLPPESNAADGQCDDAWVEEPSGWCPNQPPNPDRGYSYLCRQVPVAENYPDADLWNQRFGAALGENSAWSQYEMIATQWLVYDEEPERCENVQASFNKSCPGRNPDCAAPKLSSRERTRPQVDIPATNAAEDLDVQTRPWLGNTSMESYERSNCSACHANGLNTRNRESLRVSTDFMYFVHFETCAAWCAKQGLDSCPCMEPALSR